jgi:hypothetical protein
MARMCNQMKATLVLMVLIVTAISRLAVALERSDIDVEHYSLEYRISFDGEYVFQNALAGSVNIRFRNIGNEGITDLPLLLNRLMRYGKVTDDKGRALQIQSRLMELENFEFFQANTGIVHLAESLRPGDSTELSISFHGRLTGYVGAGMLYTREYLDPAFTILRSEVLPWPQIAEPDWLEVRRGWADPFDWTAEFDVPISHRVANGEPVEVIAQGDRQFFRYRSTRPDTYLVFPIAPYIEVPVGANRIFHLPGSQAGAQRVAEKMTQAMSLFEGWFGPLAQEGGVSIIEIPEGFGSQAKFPTIIQTADAFNSTEEIGQLYHELSHLWNVDTHEPQSPRLEEGLATFLQDLVDVKLGGNTSLDESMADISSRITDTYKRNPEYQDIAIADFGREGVTGLSYGVGALFYYDLYKSLGEEEFIGLLRGYYGAHMDGGGNFDALVEYYREHLPDDSANLVDQWLVETGYVTKLKVN